MSVKLYTITESRLKAIADAIREAEGSTGAISTDDFATRIKALTSGSNTDSLLYKVAVFSDQHTTKPTADSDWVAFTDLAKSENALAMVGCGDLSADGDEDEMNQWKTLRDENKGNIPVYTCNGNHESKSTSGYMKYHPELMRQYLDSDTTTETVNYFSKTIGGDVYAFVPIFEGVSEHKSQTMFSIATLNWLGDLLETNRNRRVFLFSHIPPTYTLLPQNFGGVEIYETNKGDYEWGTASDRTTFLNLMKHYKNVIWFTGHTHISWHEAIENNDTKYVIAKYDTDGATMVHLSSLTMPSTIDDGSITSNITAKSECVVMGVYENKVVLTYHDMVTDETHDFTINTTSVEIDASETEPITLTSISATKTTTTYNVGDAVATDDVTVTATYSDGSTAIVTDATFSTVDTSSVGAKTLTITYQGKMTTIGITVNTVIVNPDDSGEESNVATTTTWTLTANKKINMSSPYDISDVEKYGYSSLIPYTGVPTVSLDDVYSTTSYPRTYIVYYDADKNPIGTGGSKKYATPTASCSDYVANSSAVYYRLRFDYSYTTGSEDKLNPTYVHIN